MTIGQTAEYCGVERAEVYYKMLRDLEIRRIGVRGGAMPLGRLIRIERGSLLRLQGRTRGDTAGTSALGDAQAGGRLLPSESQPDPKDHRS
jgi:hypothetical protein